MCNSSKLYFDRSLAHNRETVEIQLFSSLRSISFFTDKNYVKIKGVVHVTDQTKNHKAAKIKIDSIDTNGNSVTVYTSPELTNLSDPVSFEADISGATIIKIEQISSGSETFEFVISEAYFYNE